MRNFYSGCGHNLVVHESASFAYIQQGYARLRTQNSSAPRSTSHALPPSPLPLATTGAKAQAFFAH